MIVKVRRGTKRDVRWQILGDTISSSTWTVSPDTSPTRLGTPVNTGTATTVRVTVGTTTDIDLTIMPHVIGTSGQEYEPVTALTIRVV